MAGAGISGMPVKPPASGTVSGMPQIDRGCRTARRDDRGPGRSSWTASPMTSADQVLIDLQRIAMDCLARSPSRGYRVTAPGCQRLHLSPAKPRAAP